MGQSLCYVVYLQLTQKKTALQFKTLDQTLQTFNKETGQKQALSYRCADIDRIVPSLMGVSKVCSQMPLLAHSLPDASVGAHLLQPVTTYRRSWRMSFSFIRKTATGHCQMGRL